MVVKMQNRKLHGKYSNDVALNLRVSVAQDLCIDQLCEALGKSKAGVIREAIQLYFGYLKNQGVL